MKTKTMDGNAAASYISYAFSEIAVIYPITPSSPMAELADEWAAKGKPNLFGSTPKVVQMQSEGGVAGAVHGSLTCGALTTTYTCSQGLLLMLPNMYKIAGELLPTVFHVSARALAAHALSIFGDHQDVMACRQTGFAMLASSSVQEVMDLALVAHLSTLKTSVPFLHFFDGFRTSHEYAKIEEIEYDEIRSLVDESDIAAFKRRALTPDAPIQRGTAQNPDVYFQNRERANPYYLQTPQTVQAIMDKVATVTGRKYRLFDYFGAEEAETIVVMMGSGASTMEETVERLNAESGDFGLIKVRLYRPFCTDSFVAAIPKTCKNIVVLDRTKEAGALGEPLYLDICTALAEKGLSHIRVIGGRYGLGSKEFTPSMCYAVLENATSQTPKNHFTVGICDDITHASLDISKRYAASPSDHVACVFYGLGSDGTVGANKSSIKIIGDRSDLFVQGYFCYDSRKSGGVTVSHLRFGRSQIRSAYLIDHADFTACHNPSYLTRYDMLGGAKDGGVFLLNCPWESAEALNERIPAPVKRQIAQKKLTFYTVNATKLANDLGLKGRTSTIMQAAFFLLNGSIMPYEEAIGYLKKELADKFYRKGEDVVQMNIAAIDRTKAAVKKFDYPDEWESATTGAPLIQGAENEYFQSFIRPILALRGDDLPVSAFQADGSVPTGTTKFEKHGLPYLLPEWIPENCIQCNQCSFVCPHACIRPFVTEENADTPQSFTTIPTVGLKNTRFRVQVSPHDCMGCGVCANTCPAKEKALVMKPAVERMPQEGANWEYAQNIRQPDLSLFKRNTIKGSQFYPPLFEFSYACSGCGETPYIKVLTQLFGEKILIANATGCSSIYGGSSPTCPYTVNAEGKGPAWANSLFEDNAEFGLGMRLAYNAKKENADRSVWVIGGDGWAYDIGYGGLDHVLALGENVNILVLDSEVYSNTGGQCSKATPTSAVARFAAAGKRIKKKDLGLMAMSYGYVYVAQVSMGANKQQFLNALSEAESYDGPSLIIAYSPCIAHGANMSRCMDEERLAVECGYWALYRFDPRLKDAGKNPFVLDSKAPTADFRAFLMGENRFASLKKIVPDEAEALFAQAEAAHKEKLALYQKLAQL
ncbi:MAG: pyruvate:ferredoxin (flavodoxin) oxidoreductase [Clostridia bacterium]|nr:pyruvate:ferredoxin (flavodoxin) oxidoreductase [Clostridia bacterium]